MAQGDLESFIQNALRDPRITPATRATLERVFASPALSHDEVVLLCAQALVVARASQRDRYQGAVFDWLLQVAHLVRPEAKPAAGAPSAAAPSSHSKPPAERASSSRAFFSPGDACLEAIRGEFAHAKRTADVCVYTITDDRIRNAMLEAKRRGVVLRVVSDDDKSQDEGSDIEPLRQAGVEVRLDASEAHMHHKFAVFDGARLLTGSYNWTRSAANYNQENVVLTEDPALVQPFAQEFERLWASFGPQGRRR